MRSNTLILALLLVATSAPAASMIEDVPEAGTYAGHARPMQGDHGNPIWAALAGTGRGPEEWGVLLTTDADSNGRTDFLDLVLTEVHQLGLAGTTMDVLVYADPEARQLITETVPGAKDFPDVGAVFAEMDAAGIDALDMGRVELVVWEPRIYAAASHNPAGGNPSNMDQMKVHQGGAAWSAGYTGNGTTIAVLDTGADPGHDSLDDGKIVRFKDCVNSISGAAYDDHGHGTHVASIAAGNDTTEFRGLAYEANLTIIKVLDDEGGGNLDQFECGIHYLVSGGPGNTPAADVGSLSAGLAVPPLGITTLNGGENDLFGWDTVAERPQRYRGLPFTVAAGNWQGTWPVEFMGIDETTRVGVNGVNQVSSPGFANRLITVGAVDRLQSPATFTALGPGKLTGDALLGNIFKPDVAAMGVATWGALEGTGGSYEQLSGTSMATPLAAGALALLIEKDDGLTWHQYRDALRNGATPSCIVGASATTCASGLSQPVSPNFVDGWGVVKASNSLALV